MTTPALLANLLESLALALRQSKHFEAFAETVPRPLVRVGSATIPRPTLSSDATSFLTCALAMDLPHATTIADLRVALSASYSSHDSTKRELAEARQELASHARARAIGQAAIASGVEATEARVRQSIASTRPAPGLLDAIVADSSPARQPVAVAIVAQAIVAQAIVAQVTAKASAMVRVTFPQSEQSHVMREAGVSLDELRGICRWVFVDRANPKAGGYWQGATPTTTPARNVIDRLQRFGATVSHV